MTLVEAVSTLTAEQRAELLHNLQHAIYHQGCSWDALSECEAILNLEIEPDDLGSATAETSDPPKPTACRWKPSSKP